MGAVTFPGLGTVINVAGILIGGLLGKLCGRFLNDRIRDSLQKACGISTIFLALASAMSGMLSIDGGSLTSGRSLLIIGCLAPGALIGELLNLEGLLDRLGEWLKKRSGAGGKGDARFVEGFVSASVTVCVGAMAIIGPIEDALNGDVSILVTKTILDMIIVMVLTCSMGVGAVFSALPVAVIQGLFTLIARLVMPFMTDAAMGNISLVGATLIFCVGLNLVREHKIRVANMLPAIVFAVAAAFIV